MSALPGTPAIQNAIPMPFFGTTPFAAPGLGIVASAVMLGFRRGVAWPRRSASAAAALGEVTWEAAAMSLPKRSRRIKSFRERATTAREFDPADYDLGAAARRDAPPPIGLAALPLAVVA